MSQRTKERLGGVFIALVGAGLLWRNWSTALNWGYIFLGSSFFGPCVLVMGLALLIIPSYKTERQHKGEDISQLQGLALLTPRWKVVMVLGIMAGLLNVYLLTN